MTKRYSIKKTAQGYSVIDNAEKRTIKRYSGEEAKKYATKCRDLNNALERS